jgi:hypothetical protein
MISDHHNGSQFMRFKPFVGVAGVFSIREAAHACVTNVILLTKRFQMSNGRDRSIGKGNTVNTLIAKGLKLNSGQLSSLWMFNILISNSVNRVGMGRFTSQLATKVDIVRRAVLYSFIVGFIKKSIVFVGTHSCQNFGLPTSCRLNVIKHFANRNNVGLTMLDSKICHVTRRGKICFP